jgi:tRNA-specific 2-thiouridylase
MIIAVAMSGGVDSSVTAALLKQQGHDVIGITMRLFAPRSSGVGSAVHDAAVVAQHLGIPHHIADFEQEFSSLIIGDFINEYRMGHTPNPCVRCNRHIKFGLLLKKARELGADLMATGHYVRKTNDPEGTCHLRTAINIRKDLHTHTGAVETDYFSVGRDGEQRGSTPPGEGIRSAGLGKERQSGDLFYPQR